MFLVIRHVSLYPLFVRFHASLLCDGVCGLVLQLASYPRNALPRLFSTGLAPVAHIRRPPLEKGQRPIELVAPQEPKGSITQLVPLRLPKVMAEIISFGHGPQSVRTYNRRTHGTTPQPGEEPWDAVGGFSTHPYRAPRTLITHCCHFR